MSFTFRLMPLQSRRRAEVLVCAFLALAFCPALTAQTADSYLITTVVGVVGKPTGMAADASGNLYIADESGDLVWKLAPQGLMTAVAGSGTPGFGGDGGLATAAQIKAPIAVAVDGLGNLYIADSGNFRIRKVSPQGIITTVAGNGATGFTGDGGPAISAQISPSGLAVDTAGNLYLSTGPRVRKVTPQGGISTVAGNPQGSYADGIPATSAILGYPVGLATDFAGSLYIMDLGTEAIRKVTPQGIISTVVAGIIAGHSEDGSPAPVGGLSSPAGIALDQAGSLFVVDTWNNRIRKVTRQGTITTVAGTGSAGTTAQAGDGGPAILASLYLPFNSFTSADRVPLFGIAVSPSGRVYFATGNGIKELVPTSQTTASCVYSIDQNTQSFGAAGATSSVGVLASASTCPWLAGTTVDWITVTPAGVQNGTGVLAYTVAPNPKSASRTGTAWIAGAILTVNQAGVVCSFNASPANIATAPGGVTGSSLSVSTDAPDCQWTAVAVESWILVSAGMRGAGNGSVTYTVGVNTGALRTGTITVAGQKVYINQAAAGTSVSSLASIDISGVANAASFSPPISPGGFITIYGQNLADITTDWSAAITNGKLPTSLGGVQVLINGKSAFISYVQPTQVNAIALPDTATGPVEVDVITNHGTVAALVNVVAVSPRLFTYPLQGMLYAAALFNSDGAYVGAVGAIPGENSRPAQGGDHILLFATGLGQTKPPYPVGQVLTAAYPIPDLSKVSVLIGGKPANVEFAGITYPGLFQINIQVPNGIPAGDQPIVLGVAEQKSLPTVFLTFGGG